MQNEDVIFRRIGGRIVPIRATKKERKTDVGKVVAGVGFLGAGVSISAKSGQIAAKRARKAERISRMTERFVRERSDFLSVRAKGSPAIGFAKARKQLKSAKRTVFSGQILGGVLMAQGVKKLIESQGIETDTLLGDIGSEFLIEGGAQVSSAIINREISKAFKKNPSYSNLYGFGKKIIKRKLGLR